MEWFENGIDVDIQKEKSYRLTGLINGNGG